MRAKLQVNFDPGQDFRLPCDSTSGNLNKTSVREKSKGANRLSFSELFDDISLHVKREKIMRGCG